MAYRYGERRQQMLFPPSLEEDVPHILSECEATDQQEQEKASLVKMKEDLCNQEALRKQKVELPFGHIKRNLKMDSFLLRGLKGVKAEASVLSSCFNIARMISKNACRCSGKKSFMLFDAIAREIGRT